MSVKTVVTLRVFNHREKDSNAELCITASPSEDGKGPITVTVDNVEDAAKLAGSISGRTGSLKSLGLKKPPPPKTYPVDYFFNFFSDENAAELKSGDDDGDAKKKTSAEMVGMPVSDLNAVWSAVGQQMLSSVISGRDVVVLTSGAVGSGKSYALLNQREGNRGIVFRALDDMFKLAKDDDNERVSLFLEVFEVHCEKMHDLLQDRSKWYDGGLKPKLLKDGNYDFGLVRKPIKTAEEMSAAINYADCNRSVGSIPGYNPCASRALTAYKITLVQEKWQDKKNKPDDKKVTTSALVLCDLPGRLPSAAANSMAGQMRTEQGYLNKGLSSLERCVTALATGERASMRDTKFTLALHGELSKGDTWLFGALSPASICADDSKSTLSYISNIWAASNGVERGPDSPINNKGTTSRSASPSPVHEGGAPAAAAADNGGAASDADVATPLRSGASPSPAQPHHGPRSVMAYQGPDGVLIKKLEHDPAELRKQIDETRRKAEAEINRLNAEMTKMHQFRRVQAWELDNGNLTTKKPPLHARSSSPRK